MTNDYGKKMRPALLLNGAVMAVTAVLQSPAISARTLGLVADNSESAVTVFDADTDSVLGSVPIPPGSIGDVLISPDQRHGFVTNFNGEVFVIDLTASPPRLADGKNPIPITNNGEDLSISPDGKYLVIADGSDPQPISVIDIAARSEIHTFSRDSDTNSVDVCSDGSVLVTSSAEGTVRRLTIDSRGALEDTGDVLSLDDEPNNVFCAPDAKSGLVVTTLSGSMTSFTVPGLERVDTRTLSGNFGISGLVDSAGDRVYVRSSYEGFVDVFSYDGSTAALDNAPALSIPISVTFGFFGIDQMALYPGKDKLYVPEYFANALSVYDAKTGALLTSITDQRIVQPTGVALAAVTDPCAGPPPEGAIVGTDGPDVLRGTQENDVIFGLGGNDVIDGGGGDDLICGGPGNDAIKGGPGDDTIGGGTGDDVLAGDAGNDKLSGDDGDDTISGGDGDDIIDGGAGRDRADGGSGKDIVNGGDQDDWLNVADGTGGNDTVDGGAHVDGDLCLYDPGDTVLNCNP